MRPAIRGGVRIFWDGIHLGARLVISAGLSMPCLDFAPPRRRPLVHGPSPKPYALTVAGGVHPNVLLGCRGLFGNTHRHCEDALGVGGLDVLFVGSHGQGDRPATAISPMLANLFMHCACDLNRDVSQPDFSHPVLKRLENFSGAVPADAVDHRRHSARTGRPDDSEQASQRVVAGRHGDQVSGRRRPSRRLLPECYGRAACLRLEAQ